MSYKNELRFCHETLINQPNQKDLLGSRFYQLYIVNQ